MITIVDGEGPVVTLDMNLACIKDPAVMVSQYRQHDLMVQFAFRGHPLHVEIGRISARLPVLQHIPPPEIVLPADGHVVGHDVEKESEVVRAERSG